MDNLGFPTVEEGIEAAMAAKADIVVFVQVMMNMQNMLFRRFPISMDAVSLLPLSTVDGLKSGIYI